MVVTTLIKKLSSSFRNGMKYLGPETMPRKKNKNGATINSDHALNSFNGSSKESLRNMIGWIIPYRLIENRPEGMS